MKCFSLITLGKTPDHKTLEEKMDIFNYIQITNFYIINKIIKKLKDIRGKKYLQHVFPI